MSSHHEFPLSVVAELSYRCPLQCPYCSNPTNLDAFTDELSTADWLRFLGEARELGAVQLGLTGGEPLVRSDLEEIAAGARELGFYVNLITSGVGLVRRLPGLIAAGVENIQISFQAADAQTNDEIAGQVSFARKIRAARSAKESGVALGLNFVIHRHNIAQTTELLALADELQADYVEFANVQFDGWARTNRSTLLPTAEQIAASAKAVESFHPKNPMQVYYVEPDYFSGKPKACGRGWGSTQIVVAPSGLVLPCLGAAKLPLPFPKVQTHSAREAWGSPAFAKYRGTDWLPATCQSCPQKEEDFGGCRCQAFLLTGDAANMDPACKHSPDHAMLLAATKAGGAPLDRWRPRQM